MPWIEKSCPRSFLYRQGDRGRNPIVVADPLRSAALKLLGCVVRRKQRPSGPAWTVRDQVLQYTCELACELAAGGPVVSAGEVPAPFAPALGEELPLWGAGPFALYEWRAPGDGSWQSDRMMIFGTGAVGAGLMIGSLIGGAIADSRARHAAEAAAIPRWMSIEHGELYLSHRGFYLHTPRVLVWGWDSVTAATIIEPAAVRISGHSVHGQVCWLLRSDWAELLFVTWALTRHPGHPQLVNNQWLPPGWLTHAHTHHKSIRVTGRPLPPAQS
jgi:hypothetical protein